jgi:hypothetical protein
MKKIKRRGLYCTKHKQPCEDAHILSSTFKYCEGGVRCDCPKCKFAATVTDDGARAMRDIPGGFEVIRTGTDE